MLETERLLAKCEGRGPRRGGTGSGRSHGLSARTCLVLTSFTLVEMLVVMAVIAVLAGLLMTGLLTARKTARKSQCMSNLRQIGIGLQMYLDDYNRFPVATNMPSQKLNNLEPINRAFSQYLKAKEVFKCSLDNKGYFENEESSYEWNTRLNGRKYSRKTDKPREALWDYEPFHGEPGQPKSRNILYTDGRAVGL